MALQKEWIKFLREQYPPGSRIKLREMKDPWNPVPPGTMGTLEHIDEVGHFYMKWDNGQTLSLIIGEDSFSVLPSETQTLKLYMPLSAEYFPSEPWEYDGESLTDQELLRCQNAILAALINYRSPEESERGIMHWYSEADAVNDKVHSVVFSVEERNNQLWGVAECRIAGTLSAGEMNILKDYISGQASDGWGEGFEQREIDSPMGYIFVHLWSFSNWSLRTEEECFGQKAVQQLSEPVVG